MTRRIILGDQEFNVPDKFPKSGLAVILLLVVLFMIWSAIYRVELEEVGVLMTVGKYTEEMKSGLHIKWPAPLQTVIKVPVKRELEMEFGQRGVNKQSGRRINQSEFEEESLMLTGDLNVAMVPWKTQYRIGDAFKFLFKVRDPIGTFRDMNEAVMREVIGDRSVNEVLTTGRQEIATDMENKLQKMCDQYDNGIIINRILLQKVLPPKQVQDAFNEVNTAEQEKERMINEALGGYNRIIPRAKGEAEQTVQQAEGYATDRVNRAKGDASLFNDVLAAYKRAPDVTRRRIYLETMADVYPAVKQKIILDKDLEGVLPLLPLGKDGK
ncbi:MAG: FtsH protease activity modulator HflK [Candidatus Neomarinimicrobiota bacterium]|nr:FtsH protease activity modulator HflK [Candidatus Neomarinimicrobiota bacterium]